MDKLNNYQQIIQLILNPYLDIKYANGDIKNRPAYDYQNNQYLVISEGWQGKQHLHSCLIHVEIIDNKVWIQCDNTEEGIANKLVSAGIAKTDIVLGFHEPEVRQYTGFAVA